MLNCWRVNESGIVDITEFLIQKLSAVSVTKSFLELGGDEYDNLNFRNFKIDSFKIRKNSWILGNFKTRKIRIFNLWFPHVYSLYLHRVHRCSGGVEMSQSDGTACDWDWRFEKS